MRYNKREIQDFFITLGLIYDKSISEIRLEPTHVSNGLYISAVKNAVESDKILFRLGKYKSIIVNGFETLSSIPYEIMWADVDMLNEKTIDNIFSKFNEKINKAMFDDLGLNKEDEQSNIIDNFKKLYSEFSVQKKKKHIPSVDPYTKIKQLEKELQITTKEVQEYIDYYKDNLLLKEAENFDSVLKDLDTYRKKLDILMNSDAYKKSKGDNVDIKKEIKANLEQYTKSTSLLLNQTKQSEIK